MARSESPEEIERDIAARRDALGHTLDTLQTRVAPGALAEEAGAVVRGAGADLVGAAGRMAARNPMAVALILGGVAWLALRESGALSSGPPERKAARRAAHGLSDQPGVAAGSRVEATDATAAPLPPGHRRLRGPTGADRSAALKRHAEAQAARAEEVLAYERTRAARKAELERAAREAGTASHAPPSAGPGTKP